MAEDLDKPLLDPENFNRDGVDLIEDFGFNKLEEKTENKFLKFLSFMWNPLSWVMEAAAVMHLSLLMGEGPDWQDFVGIIILLIINSTISFIEEKQCRECCIGSYGSFSSEDKGSQRWALARARCIYFGTGDIISIKLGDIVPADARLLEGDPLKIDQATLTGESLPVTKRTGDEVFSGSTCPYRDWDFCICSIAVGMILEIIVMFPIQHRSYRDGSNNLLVLLIGGIPIAMPTVLSVTLAIGSHRLSQQGAITKRMTAIEEMAGMDVLCSDKTGTLTLNRLTVDRNLVEVFNKDIDKDAVILFAARAARLENQDAMMQPLSICLLIQRRANITEVHFLPFNPVDSVLQLHTLMLMVTGIGPAKSSGTDLCPEKDEIAGRVHNIIDKFAERGLRSLGVAYQEVPEKTKESPGGPWTFCGLLPLFDPPRHDSAETIRRALNLGVCVKMITGDQLAIAKETGRRLGMGTNMYPSSSLLGRDRDKERTRSSSTDIGIAVADATDAARSASDIVLTEPGLSVIVSAVLTSRAIFQRMKNYTIYAVSITIRIVVTWFRASCVDREYDFPPFMVLIIAILNDGTIMTISQDRVKPTPKPDSWKLNEIFATGIVIGTYLALVTVLFYWVVVGTDFFEQQRGISSAIYLQVSIISQALIFVTRSQGWSFLERPGTLLMCAFVLAQLVATLIAVYAESALLISVALDGDGLVSYDAWNLLFDRKTAFTSKKDYGKEDRAAKWVLSQRSLQGLADMEINKTGKRSSLIAEQAGGVLK
ncbi:hypothetical protein L7F22_053654 [Adiantum nelumboides]|nr:hypothetical protein [Adiantum nelumboides]